MPAPAAQAATAAPPVRIAPPDSAEEREADRIADAVVRGASSASSGGLPDTRTIHRQCAACTAGGPSCSDCAGEEPAGTLLLKRRDAAPPAAQGVQAAASAVEGGGRPLPHAARGYFEPRFGADLSGVRVHTDPGAGAAAAGINARAFALGEHIAFAPDQFATETTEGRRLIAHELAHVLHRPAGRSADAAGAEVHRAPAGTEEATGPSGGAGGISVTIFTGDPDDPARESAEAVAKKRVSEGQADLAFPITRIEHIAHTLDIVAHRNGLVPDERIAEWESRTGEEGAGSSDPLLVPAGHPGFVRELSIIGHGSAGTADKEPFYGFGGTAYTTSELANLHENGLDLSRYMTNGATIVLEGCNTAKGDAGRLYMLQVGKIFLGKKRGTIKANTTETIAFAGEMLGGAQLTFDWPADFRKDLKNENYALLSGTWRGAGLTVRISIDDTGKLTGTYGSTGQLSGTVTGDRIDYTWKDASGSGHGSWEWNRTNGQLEGRYGNGSSATDGGNWNLKKR